LNLGKTLVHPPKREWVVGFLLTTEADRVVLIRKARPEWQAGRLNGVGGKVELGETKRIAMEREFFEETGATVTWWHPFASLTWEEGVVHFFRAFAPLEMLRTCRTTTDEAIELHHVYRLLDPSMPCGRITPNLQWLVPLAAHRHDDYDVIDVVETGTTMRKPGRLDVAPG
jgi:8-oxo-dGTP diphosphatase